MKINFKNSSIIIFVTLALLYLVGNILYWKIHTPLIVDWNSLTHFNDIFVDDVLYFNAPLLTWIMKGMFSIFSKAYFDLQIIFVNYIFFLIALYFIYKTGFELKDKKTGNIAMILFALTPSIYGISREYGHQDWHVMCTIIINIYCLIKTNKFRNRKWSILYGTSVGIGLLTKDVFPAYFFTQWLYIAIYSLIQKTDIQKISNILITISLGSLISGCHYFRYKIIHKLLINIFIERRSPVSSEIIPTFSFENIRIFTIGLSEYLISPPIFILFILGLIWFIFKYKKIEKYIIILWILIPWSIITFMPHHKEYEFAMGFVPAIILIISIYISSINNTYVKNFVIYCVTIIGILQYINFSYNVLNNKVFSSKLSFNISKTKIITINYYNKEFLNLATNIKYNKKYIYYIYNRIKKYKNLIFCTQYYIDNITLFLLKMKDMIIVPNYSNNKNTIFADMLICIGEELPLSKILEDGCEIFYYNDNNKEHFIKQLEKDIIEVDLEIKNNFSLLEQFSVFNNYKDKKYLVKIYKNHNIKLFNEKTGKFY